MDKPLDFGQYQQLKRYSFNQLNRWAVSVYQSGYMDGQNDYEEDADTTILEFDDQTMMEFLLSIDGVTQDIAEKIVQAMVEKGEKSTWSLER